MVTTDSLVELSALGEYIRLSPLGEPFRQRLREGLRTSESDLDVLFWGSGVDRLYSLLEFPVSRRRALKEGLSFRRIFPSEILARFILCNKRAREHREKVIANIDSIQMDLSRLFTREKRIEAASHERVTSAILPYMDGSTVLWLSVILSAKKDFLRLHEDPRRIPEWEDLHTNSSAGISDDAWTYITARDFLFRDDYYIDLDDPASKVLGQAVTLDDLLSWLIETCKSHAVDSSFVNPSIEHLRAQVARATGDPKLIEKYCPNLELED